MKNIQDTNIYKAHIHVEHIHKHIQKPEKSTIHANLKNCLETKTQNRHAQRDSHNMLSRLGKSNNHNGGPQIHGKPRRKTEKSVH